MRTSTLILLASGLSRSLSPFLILQSFPLTPPPSSVLAASASPILERQESSSFESIYKPAYESITNFSSEAFNNQQCKEAAGVETCNSWRENALVHFSHVLSSKYSLIDEV